MVLSSPSGYALSMQRTWRPRRVILAGLFLALAVAAYAFWPATVRWRVERHDRTVLGYCQKNNVLLTLNTSFDQTSPLTSEHLSALDLATGNVVFGHSVHFGSVLPSDNLLSSNGQFLAIHQPGLKKINVVDTITCDPVIQINNAPDYYDGMFSDNGKWFVLASANTVEVWDLIGRSRRHEFELKLLEHEQTIDTNDQLSRNDTYPPQTGMSISKDGRYFAFCKELVLTVFDLNTMKLVGQALCLGRPQFMDDGTLAVFRTQCQPLEPWATTFLIENHLLKCVMQNVQADSQPHWCISQNQSTYMTVQLRSQPWTCPDWIPISIKKSIDEWLLTRNLRWDFSLRELVTGKELLHLRMSMEPEDKYPRSVASGSFVPLSLRREYERPYMPFRVFISPDNCWLVKQTEDSIELWPLLTYWRPWYCWVTVAGLVLIAVYFVWYCRRVVMGR